MITFGPSSLPACVRNLLIANVAIYIIQIIPVIGDAVFGYGALVPSLVFTNGQVWRLFSYMFLHNPVSPFHLLFNMLAVWMFGIEIEYRWGAKRFFIFYCITGIGAGLFNILNLFNPSTAAIPVIGASGAVLGLLTAYAVYFPRRRVLVFFLFPVEVRWAVIIFGAISLYFTVANTGGSISHMTHLGGILVALVYLKASPAVWNWWSRYGEMRAESATRAAREEHLRQENYFENVIDPILKKISVSGMQSLSSRERKILMRASREHKGKFNRAGIIPFIKP